MAPKATRRTVIRVAVVLQIVKWRQKEKALFTFGGAVRSMRAFFVPVSPFTEIDIYGTSIPL